MKIEIFTKKNCHKCKILKRIFTEENIEFEEVDIHQYPTWAEDLKDRGFTSIPVVSVNNFSHTFSGIRQNELKKLRENEYE